LINKGIAATKDGYQSFSNPKNPLWEWAGKISQNMDDLAGRNSNRFWLDLKLIVNIRANWVASFFSPSGTAIDTSGNIFIGDPGNNLRRLCAFVV